MNCKHCNIEMARRFIQYEDTEKSWKCQHCGSIVFNNQKVPYETDPEDITKVFISDTLSVPRIIVTAANKVGNLIIPGVRHHDSVMRKLYDALGLDDIKTYKIEEQGFIDQYGQFVTREDARIIFDANKQISKRNDGQAPNDPKLLYSEDIH